MIKMTLLFSAIVFVVLLQGCGDKEEVSRPAVEKEYRQGPVLLCLALDKDNITVADRIHLVLHVDLPEDHRLTWPERKNTLGEFTVAATQVPADRLIGKGVLRKTFSLTLEPFLGGTYVIPPLSIEVSDGQGEAFTIATEPLTVEVKSVLSGNEAGLEDILPPGKLPPANRPWLRYLLGSIVALVLVLVLVFAGRCRKASVEQLVVPEPHELAYKALDELLAEHLVEQGRYGAFYLRLSGILRHYIEDRFGIRAPERTTEEFLQDLRSTECLQDQHKTLLREFLRHCDMVKFARHRPDSNEIEGALKSFRSFVSETEPCDLNHL